MTSIAIAAFSADATGTPDGFFPVSNEPVQVWPGYQIVSWAKSFPAAA